MCDQATFRPLLVSKGDESASKTISIPSDFRVLNDSWVESFMQPTNIKYAATTVDALPEPVVEPYNNDFNLTDDDRTSLDGKLESSTIFQFLQRESLDLDEAMTFDIIPVSNVCDAHFVDYSHFEIPPSLNEVNKKYLKIELGPILIRESFIIEQYNGILYLYDTFTHQSVSDPSFFQHGNGKPIFIQTGSDTVYYQIRRPLKDLVIVAILFHEDAISPDLFLPSLGTHGRPPITAAFAPVPYAFSFFNPFQKDPGTTFVSPWVKVDSSESFKSLGQPLCGEQQGIDLKAEIKTAVSIEMPEHSNLGEKNHTKPLLLSCLPHMICDTTVSISLSNITVQFNSTPKSDLIFFKAYFSNVIGDPIKPTSEAAFYSHRGDSLVTVYSSYPILASKKCVFSDFVRVILSKPLKPTSHIILHIFSVSKNVTQIEKVAIIPLFQDGNAFQSSNCSISMFAPKQLKNVDYLGKVKATKSQLLFSIEMPTVYYPPSQFENFIPAQVPQQIEWATIQSQTPHATLRYLLVPIASKLLALVSPQTIEYFVELLTQVRSPEAINELRSWVYHNFNPKTIKHNFLSSFTAATDQLIQSSIGQVTEILSKLAFNLDIIGDIVSTSYLNKTETWIPASIFNMFKSISIMICNFYSQNRKDLAVSSNNTFGNVVYRFHTICPDPNVHGVIKHHIRQLLKVENNPSLAGIFNFLIPFTQTYDFAMVCATQLPVRPLNEIMFSPFHPLISLTCLSASKILNSGDDTAIGSFCNFISRFCVTLENVDPTLSYRAGFALFPFLDVISSVYETNLNEDQRFQILPAILFLIAYTPSQLLKNFFASISSNFQSQFMHFLLVATQSCISKLTPEVTHINGIYDQLTQRFLQFLFYNLPQYHESLPSVIRLVSLLSTCPYQIPRNFPRIFDLVSRLIKFYPCQRLLVTNLLEVVLSKQHIARCFATSLILLFFRADFDARHTVVVSSVEVIDALTNLLLHSPVEQIAMLKLMLEQIQRLIPYFKDDILTTKLSERMIAAANIAEVIETLKLASHPPAEKCIYIMQIADQHKTFPSMRMKWLKEIVRVNTKSGNYSSAFIAQLHICAMVATIISHENFNPNSATQNHRQFNLLVTQPIRHANAIGGSKFKLTDRDFAFYPSVLAETQIDFKSISDDFQFISSDFTIDLLKSSIEEAISLGQQAELYYDVRTLMSLQLRLYASERKYHELAELTTKFSALYGKISSSTTITHDTNLSFYVKINKVYCVDPGNSFDDDEAIKVSKFEKETNELEHPHCWTQFRNIVTIEKIQAVTKADAQQIKLVQYTVKDALPRYTMISDIVDEQTVYLSLLDYTKMEAERVFRILQQNSVEFEKCFPCRTIAQICGEFTQNIERDMDRVMSVLNSALNGDGSFFGLLTILESKGGEVQALEYAIRFRIELERLSKVFHRGIEYLQSEKLFLFYRERMHDMLNTFITHFKLNSIDLKSYEGKKDPLTEHISYDFN